MKQVHEFILRILPGLIYVAGDDFNVLAVAGQGALETGWGKSLLFTEYNNVFGIKGKGVELPTTEFVSGKPVKVRSGFRVYESIVDCFRDYTVLIKTRFPKSYMFRHSLLLYPKYLQEEGYATDPHYAQKVQACAKLILKVFSKLDIFPTQIQ